MGSRGDWKGYSFAKFHLGVQYLPISFAGFNSKDRFVGNPCIRIYFHFKRGTCLLLTWTIQPFSDLGDIATIQPGVVEFDFERPGQCARVQTAHSNLGATAGVFYRNQPAVTAGYRVRLLPDLAVHCC